MSLYIVFCVYAFKLQLVCADVDWCAMGYARKAIFSIFSYNADVDLWFPKCDHRK